MKNLVLPKSVKLWVVDTSGQPIEVAKILFRIRAFARRKNDFALQPFPTNDEGVACVSRDELLSEVLATYDSGLMDYASIEECDPKVEISVLTPEEIQRAIDARMRIWRRLLNGEEKRWLSIEQLIKLYQDAASQRIAADPLNALWDGSRETYEHHLTALRNG